MSQLDQIRKTEPIEALPYESARVRDRSWQTLVRFIAIVAMVLGAATFVQVVLSIISARDNFPVRFANLSGGAETLFRILFGFLSVAQCISAWRCLMLRKHSWWWLMVTSYAFGAVTLAELIISYTDLYREIHRYMNSMPESLTFVGSSAAGSLVQLIAPVMIGWIASRPNSRALFGEN